MFKYLIIMTFLGLNIHHTRLIAQDDIADVPSQELTLNHDPQKKYFLIGPLKDQPVPEAGYGLIIIMPGGDGSAEFNPFVKRIYKNAVPPGFIAIQPVAVKWEASQKIVWPTEKIKTQGMKFTTEEFVEQLITEVKKTKTINPSKIYTLSWSSSGPAAYAMSLTSKHITGSFIAMSVFKPETLPDLKLAKDKYYFLYHSEQDRVCPFRMAKDASEKLKSAGAKLEFLTYEGGHGWRGNLYADIKQGIEWLDELTSSKKSPP